MEATRNGKSMSCPNALRRRNASTKRGVAFVDVVYVVSLTDWSHNVFFWCHLVSLVRTAVFIWLMGARD